MSEEADRLERLELMVLNYTSNIETNDTIDKYLKSRVGKEIENSFKMDVDGKGTRKNVVEKDGYYYVVAEDKNGDYRVEKLKDSQIGEKIEILTSENFDGNGKMKFDPGEGKKETLVFGDKIEGKEFCFDIRSGEITIYIDYDMSLTNEGLQRSAINIEPNAKLNLYIAEGVTLTANSGFGIVAPPATGDGFNEKDGILGGSGAYAGIRVPWVDKNNDNKRDEGEYAILNLYGAGSVYSYGGDAGDGGDGGYNNLDWGGAGRSDGAGAGIGGNRWRWWNVKIFFRG